MPGLTLQLSPSAPASQATEAAHPKPSTCSLWTQAAVCLEKSTLIPQLRSNTAAMKYRPFKAGHLSPVRVFCPSVVHNQTAFHSSLPPKPVAPWCDKTRDGLNGRGIKTHGNEADFSWQYSILSSGREQGTIIISATEIQIGSAEPCANQESSSIYDNT